MKKTLLTLAALATTLITMAGPIGKQAAMNVAKDFMKNVNPSAVLQMATARHAPQLNGSETPAYYVFNAENNQGFVIVSGDDRSEEILGYSDTGYFDVNNLPDAVEDMLNGFVKDLKELDRMGITEPAESVRNKAPRKAVSVARHPVAPLTKSKWNQGAPWWNRTPIYEGKHCPTGCGATALAQLIYYWKYANIPDTGIPGYTQTSGDCAGTVIEDLPDMDFDFSKLYDTYSTYSSDTYISLFMYYIDTSFHATYGQHGTGISYGSVPSLIKKYWGYKYDGHMNRSKAPGDFDNFIYNDLSQGLPVWVHGNCTPGGHSFLIDGYSYDDYFHINWGWAGTCNGYFLLAPLNAYNNSNPQNWGNTLDAMFGARPDAEGYAEGYTSYVPRELASLDLNNLYFTLSDATTSTAAQSASSEFNVKLTTVVENLSNTLGSSSSRSFETELTLFDAQMNIVGKLTPAASSVSVQQSKTVAVDYSIGKKLHQMNLTDGEYKLVPRSRMSGYKNFFFDRAMYEYAYVKVVKNGNNITLSLVPTFTVDKSEFFGQLRDGYRGVLRVTITNNSFTKLAHVLTLFKKNTSSGMSDSQLLRAEAQSTVQLDFGFDAGTGTNKLILVNKDSRSGNSVTGGETILTKTYTSSESGPSAKEILTQTPIKWVAENSSGSTIYGNELHAYIEITNSSSQDYSDLFTVQAAKIQNTYKPSYRYISNIYPLTIPANGKARIVLDNFDYADILDAYKNGLTSVISFSLYDGTRQFQEDGAEDPLSTYGWSISSNAYLWWDKYGKMTATTVMNSIPEDAVAVSFISKNPGSKLNPNENPNTIYYFSSTSNASNYLNDYSTHNIVTGSLTGTKTAANAVTFNDNYDAYVPYGFTASKGVTYTRTFDYGYEKNGGKGWTTICLPFKAETIMNGSSEIDWFHSASDKNKLFWVNQFFGEDYMTSLYNYTDEIAANTPYIIAMPGDSWGTKWSLINKAITFSAGNNAKVSGGHNITDGLAVVDADNQNLVSAWIAYRDMQKGKSVYSIDNPGNDFEYVSSPDLKSFRGYITKETAASLVVPLTMEIISIGENEFEGGEETDGIKSIDNSRFNNNGLVYDLQGRVVSTKGIGALPKGMYIMNGKKIMK